MPLPQTIYKPRARGLGLGFRYLLLAAPPKVTNPHPYRNNSKVDKLIKQGKSGQWT